MLLRLLLAEEAAAAAAADPGPMPALGCLPASTA